METTEVDIFTVAEACARVNETTKGVGYILGRSLDFDLVKVGHSYRVIVLGIGSIPIGEQTLAGAGNVDLCTFIVRRIENGNYHAA